MLPSPFNDWVMDIAKRQSTPPDYVAVAALTAISIVIGRKVRIYPKRYDDWLVVPNLWSMLVGRPSSGKTPAMREALKPLHKVAELAIEKFRVELTKYKAGLKLRELKVKVTEKKARTALADGDEKLAQQLLVDIVDVPAIPVEPRYIVNDTTIEKLGELLNQNPNGLLLERDELYGWLHTLDREDRSNDRTFFLEASSGDGTYTYDRIGRGTLHIPALCLSIVGGIQPARLAPYVRHAVRGDTADDGLIQRFQLAVYPDTPVFTRVDEIPNLKAQKEVLQIFITLDKLKPQTGNFISLRFNEASQEIFYDWFDNNEAIIRQKNLHPAMESHLIKFRSLIPSLALILELITNPNATCVTEQATTTACSWANYLRLHAERIYSSAINPIPINALAILSKIEDGKLPNPFVFGDIRRGHWGGLNDKTEILMALELLEERGFIRTEVIKVRSIRPSTIYHINPKIFQVQ
ncbi:hypothetical protein TI04_01035 [Achromatium sp. WMS2]|nr:hypothetical protein TI04_01035 [Achromatium sp. WMS2]